LPASSSEVASTGEPRRAAFHALTATRAPAGRRVVGVPFQIRPEGTRMHHGLIAWLVIGLVAG